MVQWLALLSHHKKVLDQIPMRLFMCGVLVPVWVSFFPQSRNNGEIQLGQDGLYGECMCEWVWPCNRLLPNWNAPLSNSN